MEEERSLTYSFISALVATLVALTTSLALVVVELIAAMFVYFYLAINEREWFGELIGHSRTILNLCIDQLTFWMPSFANAANATLVGELAPKSMLLLLIGLTVGALLRFVLWVIARILRAAL